MKTFDVVAVSIKKSKVELFAEDKTFSNAEAVVRMAIMRRGLADDFYAIVPHKMYANGDKFTGDGGAEDPDLGIHSTDANEGLTL